MVAVENKSHALEFVPEEPLNERIVEEATEHGSN